MIENFTISSAVLIALIGGIVSAAKWAGLPSKYAGLLSLVLGLLLGGVAYMSGVESAYNAIISGAVMGLIASGAYSGTKAFIKK